MAVGAGSRNNDPAGPRKDSSGLNASSASRPSGGGYNSATRGGNISSNGLGLTTGATMFGNTAFGPAGGRAVGYATNSRLPSGVGPSMGVFSNFRTPSGAPMVGGGLQNRAVTARNPQQALGMLQALAGAQRPRVGGLLADEGVTVGNLPAIPSIVPTAAPAPLPKFIPGVQNFANYPFPEPMMAGGWMQARNWDNFAGNWPTPGSTMYKTPGSTMYKPTKSIHHKTSGYGSLRGR